jgi:phospholipid/cholesterol/gamma-HCH transport system substrate-binding protein
MADNKRRNALIGLFVLGGIVALGVLTVKFGESQAWFGNTYIVQATFNQVMGVREGTMVSLAGVPVGSVTQVYLANPKVPSEGVRASMQIGKEYLIPQDSVAEVLMQLMGQPIINIQPPPQPTPPLPQDGSASIPGAVKNPLEQVINPQFMASLQKTTNQIGTLAQALTPAADAITNLLQQRSITEVESPEGAARHLTANLYTAVERLYSVLTHIDTVIGDPAVQSNLRDTVTNLKQASEDAKVAVAGFKAFSQTAQETALGAKGVVVKLDATVDITRQRIDELGRSLMANSDRLARALDYFASAGRDLAEGNGTLGLFLRDPKFYQELLLTVQRIGNAASEMTVFIKQIQSQGLLGALR